MVIIIFNFNNFSRLDRSLYRSISHEILQTEITYVNDLAMLIEGYYKKMQQLPYASVADLDDLFINLPALYEFHSLIVLPNMQYLIEIDADISLVFLHQPSKWISLYSQYCAHHERATRKLAELKKMDKYRAFFLGCKLLVSQNIDLDGFLLVPVQRLCRYPLLLKVF